MSWDRDPLLAKARLFFGRAIETQRDDPAFGLWCSLGLELLARAALASISPTLLAEPHSQHINLLHVVHREAGAQSPKSIAATTVFELCHKIFPVFSDDDLKVARALLNRRNEELHSGTAAFDTYTPSQWLVRFYHASQSLCTVLGETLDSLLGDEETRHAERLISENRRELQKRVLGTIEEKKRNFAAKPAADQQEALARARQHVEVLSYRRHHKVTCPACQGDASLQGVPFGREHTTIDPSGDIVIRQSISPNGLSCEACGLSLVTYGEVEIAGLADPYTRATRSSPEDYYGLISPDDLDSHVENYLRDREEYDNE